MRKKRHGPIAYGEEADEQAADERRAGTGVDQQALDMLVEELLQQRREAQQPRARLGRVQVLLNLQLDRAVGLVQRGHRRHYRQEAR
jgi:hypothetical protein